MAAHDSTRSQQVTDPQDTNHQSNPEFGTPESGEPGPISIEVATRYLESDSDPDDERFVFAYTITITNNGESAAQLLTRHWIITHGNGKTQEVKGDGVVGKQPLIKPGQGYQYTSGTILETPVGTMGGSYQMVNEEGQTFAAAIPDFVLSTPHTLH